MKLQDQELFTIEDIFCLVAILLDIKIAASITVAKSWGYGQTSKIRVLSRGLYTNITIPLS